MPKVLISDSLSARAVEIFNERGIETDVITAMKPKELVACISEYDGLAVRSATKVTNDVLDAAIKLRVIGRAGIGVDNIDVDGASGRGIVVMNAPFGNSITTAEHAIAMMFALARQIPLANQSTQSGQWEKSRFMGVELTGKVLGIIGCGNIGSIVAERAIGIKMKVIAFDPYLTPDHADEIGVEKVELGELYARAEIISLHTPSTETTRGMVNADAFHQMRDGVFVVNCARGELVVEADMKAAIEIGKVGGFAVDVFPQEPPEEYSLFGMEQVIATPHLGAATTEAQEKVALQIAEQMSDYLNTGAVVNALNMPSVSAEDAPRLKPYMTLARLIGGLAGQVIESGIRKVTTEFEGNVLDMNTRPVSACLLEGLLSPLLSGVNMINAPILARDRSIDVSEVRHERGGEYQTLIRLTVETENQSRTVAGTLFGGDKPRIVEINGIKLEAELAKNMLYMVNKDRPGFIGRLGTTLGDAGVNIATFQLGRVSPGSDALALIQVDGELTDDVLDQLCALPHVVQAKALSFPFAEYN
ncbi:MAG: D-3-phosphoglycerate dehydrogenase [Alphaproteobacteria bacterium MarineAlpha11_Bin1]|nr:MAG: D-3-phosphoglycerate dehydrogenase [Alphaproteobacteria bacterium MarineAlpha11_Bin1]|tara:strand:+ start:791 stop:2386 length:1596 start_codon:yes stop_codon:yes gene_type:complete